MFAAVTPAAAIAAIAGKRCTTTDSPVRPLAPSPLRGLPGVGRRPQHPIAAWPSRTRTNHTTYYSRTHHKLCSFMVSHGSGWNSPFSVRRYTDSAPIHPNILHPIHTHTKRPNEKPNQTERGSEDEGKERTKYKRVKGKKG